MRRRITEKLNSQQGASFALALLVFIVCVAISSVVLAASTASIGQYADQSAADERYYAVTSAERVFIESLDGAVPEGHDELHNAGDTLTYVVKQSKHTVDSTVECAATFEKPTVSKGFDFLSEITYYAFAGQTPSPSSDKNEVLTNLLSASSEWLKPINGLENITYTVASPVTGGMNVNVVGKLTCVDPSEYPEGAEPDYTMTLELDFHNALDSSSDDLEKEKLRQYHLFVQLAGDVIMDEFSDTSMAVGGSGVATNTTEIQESTVVWSVVRVMPGGAL